ncbi:hypothetical protein [Muricoccus radiodurans]|uniref:hypothetical protein n=1 Tax=Muricoccus radiodurans TaxID=2231721 RepID=UPI003CEA70D7
MVKRQSSRTAQSPGMGFDRVAASLAALAVVGLAGFLLIRNEAIASPQLFFALRVVLSFAVAVLGATIPGFLDLGWKGSGLVVRTGGALALFVLTYVYTPNLVTDRPSSGGTTISAPGGVAAGTITGSSVTVNPAPAPATSPQASQPRP